MSEPPFRRVRRYSAALGVCAAVVLLPLTVVQPAFGSTEIPESTGLPARLKIPKLRVNAAIQHVGLAPDGSMDIPTHGREAAWYKLGPKPGEPGSAVIDGHVNWLWEWLFGATGVFARLHTLKPGDLITVQDDEGVITTFVVREVRQYDHYEDTSDVFYSYDGKSHLNLITCAGKWDKKTKRYSKRLVVFTDKVEE